MDSTGRQPSKVLLAEDDTDMRELLAMSLRGAGYHVVEVGDGQELFEVIRMGAVGGERFRPDLIVSDIRMPGRSGIEVLRMLQRSDWTMPVVLITSFGDPRTHEEAKRLGAVSVLDKPFELQELESVVRSILPPLA